MTESCRQLNATVSQNSLEPNYDGQIAATRKCQELEELYNSATAFVPIVYNLLYLSRVSEDYAVRASAVSTLKQILTTGLRGRRSDINSFIKAEIISAVASGFKEKDQAVQADFVALFGLLVQHSPPDFGLQDLQILLVNNDEEASFFTNVLHLQHHRRLRALRRLEGVAQQGLLGADHVSKYFLPLLEAFIYNPKSDVDNSDIRGQAIITLGSLLQWIKWPHFKALFRKFKEKLGSDAGQEKEAIKLLAMAADALTGAVTNREAREAEGATQRRLIWPHRFHNPRDSRSRSQGIFCPSFQISSVSRMRAK